MKIWEKNYLLTMTMVLCLLFGCMFVIHQYSFRKNLEKYCSNSILNESRVEYAAISFLANDQEGRRLEWYSQSLNRQNIYIQLKSETKVLVDCLPFSWEGRSKKDFQIVKHQKRVYACISNSFWDSSRGNISILYFEDIGSLYEIRQKQMYFFCLFAVLLAALLAAILYFAMKKIYAPISNIAHDLRTPLTAILGYSQYIQLGNISTEDMMFAGSQIDLKARYMNELIENLLIMANLRDGTIEMKQVDAEIFAAEIKQYFPFLSVENQKESLYGDRTLLLSLVRNLISNTCRQGSNIQLNISKDKIVIFNPDDNLDETMLDILNHKSVVPKDKICGKGLGVPLCREIVKMHHGTLRYRNMPEGGMEVFVRLWR